MKSLMALVTTFFLSLRNLKDEQHGFVDVGVGISIGILFAGLMIISYIVWTLRDQLLLSAPTNSSSAAYNASYFAQNATRSSIGNITAGFDNTITLLLIVVVVWLLALAIMALLVIKKKSE